MRFVNERDHYRQCLDGIKDGKSYSKRVKLSTDITDVCISFITIIHFFLMRILNTFNFYLCFKNPGIHKVFKIRAI